MNKPKPTYNELLQKCKELQSQVQTSITIRHDLVKAKNDLDDELSKFQLMQEYGREALNILNEGEFTKLTLEYFIRIYNQARGGIFKFNAKENKVTPLSVFGMYGAELQNEITVSDKFKEACLSEGIIIDAQSTEWFDFFKMGFYKAYVACFYEDSVIQGLVLIGHSKEESKFYPELVSSDLASFTTMVQSVGSLYSNLHLQKALKYELLERKKIEQALIKSEEELKLANQQLEYKIESRTSELNESNLKLKQQTSELISTNTDLRRFANVISHDLKTPLRSMGSFSGLLKKKIGHRLNDAERKYLDIIEGSSTSMYALIEDLLTYTKVNSEGLNLYEADVKALVGETLVFLDSEIHDKDAVIINKIEDCVIFCDRIKLKQVFLNLIQNAIKFSSLEGQIPEIVIANEQRGNQVLFSVRDNGIGIDEEFKDKVFVEFERLNGNKYQGSGMGLSICDRIVDKHGGKIWFVNNQQKGATFYFTIDLQNEQLSESQALTSL